MFPGRCEEQQNLGDVVVLAQFCERHGDPSLLVRFSSLPHPSSRTSAWVWARQPVVLPWRRDSVDQRLDKVGACGQKRQHGNQDKAALKWPCQSEQGPNGAHALLRTSLVHIKLCGMVASLFENRSREMIRLGSRCTRKGAPKRRTIRSIAGRKPNP